MAPANLSVDPCTNFDKCESFSSTLPPYVDLPAYTTANNMRAFADQSNAVVCHGASAKFKQDKNVFSDLGGNVFQALQDIVESDFQMTPQVNAP